MIATQGFSRHHKTSKLGTETKISMNVISYIFYIKYTILLLNMNNSSLDRMVVGLIYFIFAIALSVLFLYTDSDYLFCVSNFPFPCTTNLQTFIFTTIADHY